MFSPLSPGHMQAVDRPIEDFRAYRLRHVVVLGGLGNEPGAEERTSGVSGDAKQQSEMAALLRHLAQRRPQQLLLHRYGEFVDRQEVDHARSDSSSPHQSQVAIIEESG